MLSMGISLGLVLIIIQLGIGDKIWRNNSNSGNYLLSHA